MITEELLEFLRVQFAEGMSLQELESILISEGGWTVQDVHEAFERSGIVKPRLVPPQSSPSVPPPTQRTSAPAPLPASSPVLPVAPSPVSSPLLPKPEEKVSTPSASTPLVSEKTPLPVGTVDTPVSSQGKSVTAPATVVAGPSSSIIPPVSVSVTPPPPSSQQGVVSTEKETVPPRPERPVPITVAPSAPLKPAPPVEDFLGLFTHEQASVSGSVPSRAPAKREDQETQTKKTVSSPIFRPVAPSAAPSFGAPTPVLPTGDELALDSMDEIPVAGASSFSADEALQRTSSGGKKQGWSFQDMLAQKKMPLGGAHKVLTPSSELAPETSENAIRFDMSRLKEDSAQKEEPQEVSVIPSPTTETPPDTALSPEKTLETRSLADIWTKRSEKTTPKEGSRYTSSTPRAPVPLKRTMLSDILLQQQAKQKVVPPVPPTPPTPIAPSVKIEIPVSAPTPTTPPSPPAVPTPVSSPVITPPDTSSISTPSSRHAASPGILLRGKGRIIPSMPSISEDSLPSPVELPVTVPAPAPVTPKAVKNSAAVKSTQTPAALAEELRKRNKVKDVLLVTIAFVAILLVIAGAAYYFLSRGGGGKSDMLRAALSNFVNSSSFAYAGSASSDLVLTLDNEGVSRTGSAKFTLLFSGILKNSARGFGDGLHQVDAQGGLQTGNFSWTTDVKSDVRIMGDSLYFHLLRYPATSDFDPDVMSTYWGKVDLDAITRELALQGVSSGSGNYGGFSGAAMDTTFSGLYTRYPAFVFDEARDDELVDGILASHFKLKADREHMFQFAVALYKKYTGDDLKLSDDETLRLKNALEKIVGEVWIDPNSNRLLKLTVHGDLDDDIVGVHVKGAIQLSLGFKDYGASVVVKEPTPFLTLEELRVRLDDFKKVKELRARDGVKADELQKIIDALRVYRSTHDRFPSSLLDLRTSKDLPESVISNAVLKQFVYASYVSPSNLTKSGRCGARGTCSFYHIGVNFEDVDNPKLRTDADVVSEIIGKDGGGCAGEKNVACFDVVSTSLSTGQ